MSRVYMYVVDRDFGFAPNPFHGWCTLATCKPGIRERADVGDWVLGVGGARLEATGRCIFAMRVTRTLTFDEYWRDSEFFDKRPVRNGSRKMMVGDNIYHRGRKGWVQEDSHHSNPDGSTNPHNLLRDTAADRILASRHFFYFGRNAPAIPTDILTSIGYRNGRNYRVFDSAQCAKLISWLHEQCRGALNQVAGDPFDFELSEKRYSAATNRVS